MKQSLKSEIEKWASEKTPYGENRNYNINPSRVADQEYEITLEMILVITVQELKRTIIAQDRMQTVQQSPDDEDEEASRDIRAFRYFAKKLIEDFEKKCKAF